MTEDRNIWMIYGRDGITERIEVHELEHHSEWMEDSYITVTVKSPVPVMFKYGDFLEYRGEKYYIDYDPKKIQKARKNSYGEAFVYENVKMYHESHVLKDVLFKDYVLNDNGKAYSQQAKFSFFAESVEDLADRIQANLNKAYGENVWIVLTPDSSRDSVRHNGSSAWSDYYDLQGLNTGLRDVNISCDGISCKDALRLAYDQFGLSYVIIEKVIIIGGNKGIDLSGTLEYGKGKGLYELEKNTDETQQLVTKMYAYGSSENMPLNYYANIGRIAKATIACGSKREIIEKNKELVLWVAKSWDLVKSAFGSNLSVTLEYGNMKVHANVSCGTYTYAKEKDDDEHGLDHTTQYLYFWLMESDGQDAVDFYESLEDGGLVNITSGANVNALPSDMVSTRNDYPSLLSIQNLMLPGFPDISLLQWVLRNGGTGLGNGKATWNGHTAYFSNDAKNPWIKSVNADKIGEREGAVYFDGSNSDCENIHPTIKDTGADVVSSGSSIADNGYLAEGTDLSFNMSAVVDNDFDWGEAWANADEDIYVNMTSGYCVGRAFKLLSKPKKVGGSWKLKLERAYDSSLQRYFPYQDTATGSMSSYAQVAILDKFVVTGTQMSSSLVNAASIKLLKAALEALEEMDHPKVTYIPRIDEIEAARERDTKTAGTSLYDTIRAGLRLTFKDTTDGESNTVTQYIDSLTIKENGNNGIPTFDVVLRDEKELNLQQRIQNQISSMSGSGQGKSSSVTSPAEEEPNPADGASLTPLLFELHKKENGTDTVIDPEEWESAIEEDEEAREDAEDQNEDYVSPLSIKSKFGHWTAYFLSSLGIGSGGGGGGDALEWPLQDINAQGMPTDPQEGSTIVWNGHGFEWGSVLDTTALASWLVRNDYKTQTDLDSRYLKLLASTQDVSSNINLTGTLSVTGDITLTRSGQVTNNSVLTKGDADDLYLTKAFFNKLFRAQSSSGDVTPNDMNATITNIKSMFGTWTQQYLSALGIGSGGNGGGGVWYLQQLEDVDQNSTPSQGDALVWDGQKWTFDTAGLDTNALNTILQSKTLIIKDGSTQLGTTWNAKDGGDIDISGIFDSKTWWGQQMSSGAVSGPLTNTGSITRKEDNGQYEIGTETYRYYKIHVNELWIGGIQVKVDNNGVHIVNAGLHADKHVSALGTGSQGTPATGIDWEALTNYDGAHTINSQYLDDSEVAMVSWVNSHFNNYELPTASANTLGGIKVGSGLSIANDGTLSRSALNTSDIPDLSSTYATDSRVTTLEGYFDANGNANSALRLTTVSKKAWGKTYWTSGGVPTDISGNMSNVGNISFSATGKNIGGVAYFDTTNTRLGIGASPDYTLDVSGDIHTSGDIYIDSGKALICKINSSTTKKLVEYDGSQVTFGYGFRDFKETRIYGTNISMYSYNDDTSSVNLMVQVTKNGLKIGNITIKNENGGLHIIGGGLYTDTYLSSQGVGSGGSGSGMTEDQMWVALGTDGQTKQITFDHLSLALNGYGDKTWVQSQGYAKTADVTKTLTIKDSGGTTLQTYNGTADKVLTLPAASTYTLPAATPSALGGIKIGFTTDSANRKFAVQLENDKAFVNVPDYTLPLAGNGTLGGIQIGYPTSNQNYAVQLAAGKAFVNVPWTDHHDWDDITNKPTIPSKTSDLTNDSGFKSSTVSSTPAGIEGAEIFVLGNNKKLSVEGNMYGALRLYMHRDSQNTNKAVKYGQLEVSNELTSSCIYTFPNNSGTVALTSDIPSSTEFVKTSGNQTVGGVKTLSDGIKLMNLCMECKSDGTADAEYSGEINRFSGDVHIQWRTDSGNITLCKGGGNVSVGGSVDSGYRLKVAYKTVTENNVTYNRGLFATGLSKFDYIGINTDPVTGKRLKVNGDTLLEGNLSVGTSNTGYNFYVDGTSYLNGNVTLSSSAGIVIGTVTMKWSGGNVVFDGGGYSSAVKGTNGCSIYASSDVRQKDIIDMAECDVEDIARAPIFNFTWKNVQNDHSHLGTSAQYWNKTLPTGVMMMDDGYYAMDYGATALAAVVMTARKVVDHEEEITRLKQKVSDVEAENRWLRQEIELLKAA